MVTGGIEHYSIVGPAITVQPGNMWYEVYAYAESLGYNLVGGAGPTVSAGGGYLNNLGIYISMLTSLDILKAEVTVPFLPNTAWPLIVSTNDSRCFTLLFALLFFF